MPKRIDKRSHTYSWRYHPNSSTFRLRSSSRSGGQNETGRHRYGRIVYVQTTSPAALKTFRVFNPSHQTNEVVFAITNPITSDGGLPFSERRVFFSRLLLPFHVPLRVNLGFDKKLSSTASFLYRSNITDPFSNRIFWSVSLPYPLFFFFISHPSSHWKFRLFTLQQSANSGSDVMIQFDFQTPFLSSSVHFYLSLFHPLLKSMMYLYFYSLSFFFSTASMPFCLFLKDWNGILFDKLGYV